MWVDEEKIFANFRFLSFFVSSQGVKYSRALAHLVHYFFLKHKFVITGSSVKTRKKNERRKNFSEMFIITYRSSTQPLHLCAHLQLWYETCRIGDETIYF